MRVQMRICTVIAKVALSNPRGPNEIQSTELRSSPCKPIAQKLMNSCLRQILLLILFVLCLHFLCDSVVKFPEPLEGGYLESGNIGANGCSMIPALNGFRFYERLIVHDYPWSTCIRGGITRRHFFCPH
jgi:hypothetical protein